MRIAPIIYSAQSLFLLGSRFECPVCGGRFRKLLSTGYVKRPNARCPRCRSLERHRAMWIYLREKTPLFRSSLKLLHFAPEPYFQKCFQALPNLDYLSADLDSSHAMRKMDITAIDFPDSAFDAVLCSHVLEHVPDDRKAVREIYRVLKSGGWAILQVPITESATREDPAIQTPEDRLRTFGHPSHVRAYGPDYAERLRECGFEVNVDRYLHQIPEDLKVRYCLQANGEALEDIYFCAKPQEHV